MLKTLEIIESRKHYLSGLLQNSSLPLIKEIDGYQNILNPKIALKMSLILQKIKK